MKWATIGDFEHARFLLGREFSQQINFAQDLCLRPFFDNFHFQELYFFELYSKVRAVQAARLDSKSSWGSIPKSSPPFEEGTSEIK